MTTRYDDLVERLPKHDAYGDFHSTRLALLQEAVTAYLEALDTLRNCYGNWHGDTSEEWERLVDEADASLADLRAVHAALKE